MPHRVVAKDKFTISLKQCEFAKEGDELYSASGSGDLEKNLSSSNRSRISCDLLVISVDVLLLRNKRPMGANAIIIN